LLVQIEAEDFRNLERLSCTFAGGSHLFLGRNGAGKTSLLEAVYLLATTRSFRTPRVSDGCRHGASSFRLAAEVDGDRRVRLELGWQSGERWRTVNGQRGSLAEHLAVLPVVCWSSGDVEILVGPPAGRRQLLDRGLVGLKSSVISVITRYRRVVEEKRQLLLRGGGELETWNRVLAEAAADLVRLRAAQVERLGTTLQQVLAESALGFPPVEMRYRCSPRCALEGADAIERKLASVSGRERRKQQLLLGPHRDEVAITWDGHDIRQVASAGERKALGLALLAAQGRILEAAGRSPLYLLDDADAELDGGRLESLWRVFGSCGQLFATSSRPQIWEAVAVDHQWRLEAGRLIGSDP
jgi:DNA replication and repair protein RecF